VAQLTNVVQPDGVQATRNFSTARENFRNVWVLVPCLPLGRLVGTVSQAHQTDRITCSACHFVRNAKLNASDRQISNADCVLGERTKGGAAIAEAGVEGGRLRDNLVCRGCAVVEGASAAAVGTVSLAARCRRGVEVEVTAACVENNHLLLGWGSDCDCGGCQ
jgi:hypothetical protein